MDHVRDLGSYVHVVDTVMSGYQGITAGYVIASPRPCLVETGTATSAPRVRESLHRLGIGPKDLATIVVTHVHLDHAGGVGDLTAAFPAAEVVVHERGARHLVDPERLLASARRVFGAVLDDVFGLLRPTDAARIRAVGERDVIDLGGGRRLETIASPGHASHHIGLMDDATGDLYVGDAAGIYVPETAELRPGTPPPDFDLDLALASLQAFRDREPARLLFSHFGPVEDPDATLERSAAELLAWVEATRQARATGADLDHAVAMILERTNDRYARYLARADLVEKFEHLNASLTNVVGIMRWLDRVEAGHRPPDPEPPTGAQHERP